MATNQRQRQRKSKKNIAAQKLRFQDSFNLVFLYDKAYDFQDFP